MLEEPDAVHCTTFPAWIPYAILRPAMWLPQLARQSLGLAVTVYGIAVVQTSQNCANVHVMKKFETCSHRYHWQHVLLSSVKVCQFVPIASL